MVITINEYKRRIISSDKIIEYIIINVIRLRM